jgi:hypothetical protein
MKNLENEILKAFLKTKLNKLFYKNNLVCVSEDIQCSWTFYLFLIKLII